MVLLLGGRSRSWQTFQFSCSLRFADVFPAHPNPLLLVSCMRYWAPSSPSSVKNWLVLCFTGNECKLLHFLYILFLKGVDAMPIQVQYILLEWLIQFIVVWFGFNAMILIFKLYPLGRIKADLVSRVEAIRQFLSFKWLIVIFINFLLNLMIFFDVWLKTLLFIFTSFCLNVIKCSNVAVQNICKISIILSC